MAKAPTKKELVILARQDRVIDLRAGGASIRQISEHLTAEFLKDNPDKKPKGFSRGQVHNDLEAGLNRLHEKEHLKVKQMVQLELVKLDKLELAHFTKFQAASKPDDIEKLSRAFERIWKHRAALTGIYKPQKIELSARAALAKLLGKDPEELPNGDSDS